MRGGRRMARTLGDWPGMSIREAKAAAAQIMAAPEPVPAAPTLAQIFADWYAIKRTRLINHADIARRFEKHLLPALGGRPFADLGPQDVIAVIRADLGKRGKLETIKRLCGEVKQLEMFALNCGLVPALRLQGLSAAFESPARTAHRPSLPPGELPAVLPALAAAAVKAPVTWAALLIGFYTLLRPGEYCAMRWDWISPGVIAVPAEVMKMKRPFRVPITAPLQALLDLRPRIGPYVLSSPDRPDRPILIDGLSLFMRRHGYAGRLVPHGVRSIGRTWLAENGVPYDVAEMCLAHAVGSQVSLAYNRTDLLEERRAVMARWCAYVSACLTGAAAEPPAPATGAAGMK